MKTFGYTWSSLDVEQQKQQLLQFSLKKWHESL